MPETEFSSVTSNAFCPNFLINSSGSFASYKRQTFTFSFSSLSISIALYVAFFSPLNHYLNTKQRFHIVYVTLVHDV